MPLYRPLGLGDADWKRLKDRSVRSIKVETEFGDVEIRPQGVTIRGHSGQFYAWSHRAGASWPCSYLEDLDEIQASFDANGLIDLIPTSDQTDEWDLPSDEFNAWSSDVLRETLPADHPAYFITVGQFEGN